MTRKMKDSGIEWIGEIPEDWEVVKIKYYFDIITGSGFSLEKQGKEEGDYPVCKASDIAKSNDVLYLASNYLDKNEIVGFTIVPKGSTIMPKIGEAMKKNSRALTAVDVLLDNNCQALVPKNINEKFAYYLMKIIDMNWFDNAGTIPCVNTNKFLNFFISIPDKFTQSKIVEKLLRDLGILTEIKSSISQQIQILEEYKRSVITEAVTKGLDKNVEMKDSGIEWIGEIPKHWIVKRLKDLLKLNNGRDYKDIEVEEGGYPVIGSGGEFRRASEYLYNGESVLYGRKGTVDKPLYINEKFWTVDTMFYSIMKNSSAKYIYYYSQLFPFNYYMSSTALPSMTQKDLESIRLGVPALLEQKEIVDYLDNKTKTIDESIQAKEKQLEILEEYKKSLIYEYVTGKKEVPSEEFI